MQSMKEIILNSISVIAMSEEKDELHILELQTRKIQVACKVTNKNVKNFINIIRSLLFTTTNTELQLSKFGLKYCAEESQFFQASAFIKTSFFEVFKYYLSDDVPQVTFGIDLSKFAEFLSAFIDNDTASLKIIYYGNELPVAFVINQTDAMRQKNASKKGDQNDSDLGTTFDDPDEVRDEADGGSLGDICTEYIIQTKEPINPVNHKEADSDILSQLVLNSKILYDQLLDFDAKSVEDLAVIVKDSSVVFRSVGCVYGSTSIKIKYDNNTVLYRHNVNTTSKFCYKFTCIKHMLKGMYLIAINFSTTLIYFHLFT
jgi:hypothetical protein